MGEIRDMNDISNPFNWSYLASALSLCLQEQHYSAFIETRLRPCIIWITGILCSTRDNQNNRPKQ
jgi:hypothetical protein